jgi:hypothetical protein
VFLTFLKFDMPGCMAVDGCNSLLDSFGGDQLRVFEPRLSLMGWTTGTDGFSEVVPKKLVCEQLPVPTAHMVGLGARIEFFGRFLFSWKFVSFSSLPVSPRW